MKDYESLCIASGCHECCKNNYIRMHGERFKHYIEAVLAINPMVSVVYHSSLDRLQHYDGSKDPNTIHVYTRSYTAYKISYDNYLPPHISLIHEDYYSSKLFAVRNFGNCPLLVEGQCSVFGTESRPEACGAGGVYARFNIAGFNVNSPECNRARIQAGHPSIAEWRESVEKQRRALEMVEEM